MTATRWLDDQQMRAWRSLLVFVHRGMPEIERTFKAHDLLIVHYAILVALSEAPDQTLRLTELAEVANVTPSRLTHRLHALVEHGDVTVAGHPDDARSKNATLTESGRRRLESIAPLHADNVQRMIFDHLEPEETEALARALTKIADPLCEHTLRATVRG